MFHREATKVGQCKYSTYAVDKTEQHVRSRSRLWNVIRTYDYIKAGNTAAPSTTKFNILLISTGADSTGGESEISITDFVKGLQAKLSLLIFLPLTFIIYIRIFVKDFFTITDPKGAWKV